jgi:predicted dehydrogenase
LHAPQTIAAAEAGKHVLCEKPMALDKAKCERMIAACQANGVKLGVAYYRHFYPVIERAREIVQSGEIGMPVLAQINAFEMFNPPRDHPRAWLLNPAESGGGPMFDFGCHRIEVLVNLFGPVTEVKALTTNAVLNRQVEDTAVALFQFEGGACGVLAVTHAAHEPQDTLEIFGSLGSIHVPILNEGWIHLIARQEERVESHPPAENLHAPLIKDFVEAVFENRDPSVNGKIGQAVAMIEDKIYAMSDKL